MQSIESIVESQVGRWKASGRTLTDKNPPPVVTISREAGALGSQVARKLADEMKMDLSGKNIINQIAENSKISSEVIKQLDEKSRSFLDDLIAAWNTNVNIISDNYFKQLVQTIATIGKHGNAIIVGRGGSHIVPAPQNLRLRFIAPLEIRIKRIMDEFKCQEDDAKKRIKERDEYRRQFIKKYFHVEIDDPRNYDLVINTEHLGLNDSVELIKTIIKKRTGAV